MDEKLMTEAQQTKILANVEKAAALHLGGMDPTEALVKVATDAGYNEHVLQRMVETFNTAKTLHHMRSADDLEKAASIALADFDQAKEIMFPSKDEEVKAAYYDKPKPAVFREVIPNFNKVASEDASVLKMEVPEVPRDSGREIRQAFKKVSAYTTKARVNRDQAEEYRSVLEGTVSELGECFKRAGCSVNWYEFKKEAAAIGGVLAEEIAEIVEERHGLEQRYVRHKLAMAKDFEPDDIIDDTTYEHKLMKAACLAAGLCSHFGVIAQRWFQKHASVREALICLGKSQAPEKTADMGTLSLMTLRDSLSKASDKVLNERKPPVITDADIGGDLDISSELQKTRMGIALRDMMNEDEVIAQHASEDPAAVSDMMNELVAVSPHLANMPIALRSALRRQLEMGTTEPFELAQLQQLSSNAAKIKPSFMGAMSAGTNRQVGGQA